MFRALLIVVTVVSGLAAGLLLILSPRVDYGSFTTSCASIVENARTGGSGAPASDGEIPEGVEIVRGRPAFDHQEATERNTGVQGSDRVGRRLASDCADRRYTWSLGAGAAGLLCLVAGSALLVQARDRRGARDRATTS